MTNNQFQVYAPLQKTLKKKDNSLNEDGTLTITGVASTSNEDLTGDIIQETAIQSMKKQAITKNLHLDHQYGLTDGLIGTISEVLDTDENTLSIKAVILPKYADEIKQMLDIGINLGFSIGGYVKEYTPTKDGGWLIEDFDLMEISLTGMPANWDTFGTITTAKGLVKSKCLTGACVELIKNKSLKEDKKMAEENNNNNNESILTEEDVVSLFNELMSEKQDEIVQSTVDMVKNQINQIIDDKLDEIKDDDNNNDGDPTTDSEGEAKSTTEEEEDEEKEKSIAEAVSKAVNEQMSVFFKKLDDGRNPQPAVDQIKSQEEDLETEKNTGTIDEIAKKMAGDTGMKDAVIQQINNL